MLHPRTGRRVTGAAEFRGAVLAAVTDGATVFEQRVYGGRADVEIEFRMCAPRVQRVVGIVLNSLELRDAFLGFLTLFLRNLVCVELLLQFLRQPRRFRLRLPSRRLDGAMARLASVDARNV